MFDVLLGSRTSGQLAPLRGVMVAAVHSLLILGAVRATGAGPVIRPLPAIDTTRFVVQPLPAARMPVRSSSTEGIVPAPTTSLPDPTSLSPPSIPPIASGPPVDPGRLWSRTGVPGAGSPALGPVSGEAVLTAALVDEPARATHQPAPRYPPLLRHAGVEGRVLVDFIIDSTGRLEPGSLRIVESSNPGFDAAAVETLTRSVFAPARVGGRPVRQRARQAIGFRMLPE